MGISSLSHSGKPMRLTAAEVAAAWESAPLSTTVLRSLKLAGLTEVVAAATILVTIHIGFVLVLAVSKNA